MNTLEKGIIVITSILFAFILIPSIFGTIFMAGFILGKSIDHKVEKSETLGVYDVEPFQMDRKELRSGDLPFHLEDGEGYFEIQEDVEGEGIPKEELKEIPYEIEGIIGDSDDYAGQIEMIEGFLKEYEDGSENSEGDRYILLDESGEIDMEKVKELIDYFKISIEEAE